MKKFLRPFFLSTLLLVAHNSPAQEAPPEAPHAAEPAPAAPADVDAPPAMRRLDTAVPPEATQPAPARPRANRGNRGNPDRVGILSDAYVDAGEIIHGDAVSVLGHLTVDGEVMRDAVSVLGGSTINGHVHRDVVAVLGNLRLGPNARVDGKIVCIGGRVDRAPGAIVSGGMVQQSLGQNFRIGRPLESWWDNALKLGRPLAFGTGLVWVWIVTAVTLAFYALLALLFPGGIRRTGDLLIERPGAVILSALLTMIALPLVFLLLLVTIVGIPVALIVLPTGVILSTLFGKAAVYGLVGRRVSNDTLHPAAAVLVGGMIFVLLYLVPIAGLGLTFLVSVLGFGCSIVALSTSRKKTPPAPPSPASGRFSPPPFSPPPVPPADPSASPGATAVASPSVSFSAPPAAEAGAAPDPVLSAPAAPPPVPAESGWNRFPASPPPEPGRFPVSSATPPAPTVPNAALPRAGFWIRTGAMLIDVLPIFLILVPPGAGILFFPCLAAYSACMWKMRGTTIGGVICGLRVVRLDDRPLDWPTAIVRSLGCFVSVIVVGLGFIWVLFDDERQSWHDKIAGTVIVHAPKGTSLV